MKPIHVKGAIKDARLPHRVIEFYYIGGSVPYLRMAVPGNGQDEEYLGVVDGRAAIVKLRDYLTRALRETP